jgi:hypothetical protein
MTRELLIRDVFRLSNGTTVIACEGGADRDVVAGCKVSLVINGKVRQTIVLKGEQRMLNQRAHRNQRALETEDVVEITEAEARSEVSKIVFE